MSDKQQSNLPGDRDRSGAHPISSAVLSINRNVTDPELFYPSLLEAACLGLGASLGALVLVRENRPVKLAATVGADACMPWPEEEQNLSFNLLSKAIATGELVWGPPASSADWPLFGKAATTLALPLTFNQQLLAVLVIGSETPGALTETSQQWLQEFAAHGAQSLHTCLKLQKARVESRRWHELFEHLPDGVVICDAGLKILHANHAFLRMFHRTLRYLLDSPAEETFYKLSIFSSQTPVWKLLKNSGRVELPFRTPSSRRSFHLNATRTVFDHKPGYLISLRETTHSEAVQSRIIQSEKLDCLSQLVTGIANQFNNPLQTLVGLSEVLARECQSTPWRRQMEWMHEASQRTAHLFKSLLLHGRQLAPDLAVVDLVSSLDHILERWRQSAWNQQIKLQVEIFPQNVRLALDAFQFEQALWHLLDHLQHALLIEPVAQPAITVKVEPARDTVRLTLHHNGHGLPAGSLDRLFDPNFNRLKQSVLNGLELHLARKIIKEHGGLLWCLSEGGHGLSFHLELPVQPAEDTATEAPRLKAPPTSGPVLVIDDEPAIGLLLQQVLNERHIQTDVMEDASHALKALEEKPYELILCDLRMPNMSGEEFFNRLVESQPAMADRVIFSTGDPTHASARLISGRPIIQKPFRIDQLVERITRKLESLPQAS